MLKCLKFSTKIINIIYVTYMIQLLFSEYNEKCTNNLQLNKKHEIS